MIRLARQNGTELKSLHILHVSNFFLFQNDANSVRVKAKKADRSLNGKYMLAFSDDDLRAANAWLDPVLEAKFGYRLFGTVAAARQPYNRVNRCSYHGACPAA
mmetsp:Transcript_51839/g.135226  ORF Transcript_51839/g.135226 Transcript_51839/m.135226 type:complete len:103 (+) Transcript_51839:1995-2303(+)